MKCHISLPFIASAIVLVATTNLVSADWLPAGEHHSYPDYCSEKGILRNKPHVCFKANSDVSKKFLSDPTTFGGPSDYQGYISGQDPTSESTTPDFFSKGSST